MKQKFYGTCNSLLRRSGRSELVKVQLIKLYCIPSLIYSLGGLSIKKNCDVLKLGLLWNDGFRTIFNMHRWEYVKFVQFMCSKGPFEYYV